jgi:chemotaxis signal transduction protein
MNPDAPSLPSEGSAAAHAASVGSPADFSAGERYLVFTTGPLRLAVPVGRLRELAQSPAVTPLPLVPPWIRGLTQLRGDVLALIDLLPFLGSPELPDRPANRMLVLGLPDGEPMAGLLVERVHGAAVIAPGGLNRVVTAVPGILPLAPYLAGGFEDEQGRVAVLDVDRLMAAMAVG